MKKIKKILAALAAAAMYFSGSAMALPCMAQVSPGGDVAVPYNVAIAQTSTSLTLGTLGKLTCYGFTKTELNYTAAVKVELQQYKSSWTTIKTWSDDGGNLATVDEEYYVSSGYLYRLKLTHSAYDSSGNLVESFIKYSSKVNYNASDDDN